MGIDRLRSPEGSAMVVEEPEAEAEGQSVCPPMGGDV
jgi:hypothetical protein